MLRLKPERDFLEATIEKKENINQEWGGAGCSSIGKSLSVVGDQS